MSHFNLVVMAVNWTRSLDKKRENNKFKRRSGEQLERFYKPLHALTGSFDLDASSNDANESADRIAHDAENLYDFLMANDYQHADVDDIGLFQTYIADYLQAKKKSQTTPPLQPREIRELYANLLREFRARVDVKYVQKINESKFGNNCA